MVTTALAFRLLDQVQIMTQGGPNGATATVISLALPAVFTRQQKARPTATTPVFFLQVLAVTLAAAPRSTPGRENTMLIQPGSPTAITDARRRAYRGSRRTALTSAIDPDDSVTLMAGYNPPGNRTAREAAITTRRIADRQRRCLGLA